MKKQLLYLAVLVAGLFTSCSDNFLTREPAGSVINQEQFDKLDNTLEGSMQGVYGLVYSSFGDGQDTFGKRALDLYTDIFSGDIAMQNYNYGWFYYDERMLTSTNRNGRAWFYYYRMLRNINKVIAAVKVQDINVLDSIAVYGFPSQNNHTYTESEAQIASYYAQALTMRGFCYLGLMLLFEPSPLHLQKIGKTFETYQAIPVYTENNMNNPQPYSNSAAVYQQIEKDLTDAIEYFDEFKSFSALARESKLQADINTARALLAYAMLNKGTYYNSSNATAIDAYTKASKYANDVITSGQYTIIPNAEVLTTGFNDVNHSSWMWGQDVNTETSGMLNSFWGHVDIYSYGYAWLGDGKILDSNLKAIIPAWDNRQNWFNDGSVDSDFKDCPSGKFFSNLNTEHSTDDDKIDRQWLSDNVFMRIESVYLTAAEAEMRLGNEANAVALLNQITDQRQTPEALADPTAYNAYKATLTGLNLAKAIEYNWRIEMWGEGYALQTFRRQIVTPDDTDATTKRVRGANHLDNANAEIVPDERFTFDIPTNEIDYNPNIGKGDER